MIWTRHRLPPDITPSIRRWFAKSGFEEVAVDVERSGRFVVGVERLISQPACLRDGERLFTFVADWPKELDG